MADVTDVCSTLVGLVSGLIYPNGTSQPSVVGVDARVFAGWPIPATLDNDLAQGTCQVSVYPMATERNTTRYLTEWQTATLNTPTLTLTYALNAPWNAGSATPTADSAAVTADAGASNQIIVGGAVPNIATNPHNLCVFVNGIPYLYAVQPADTLSTIATALATLIAVAVPGVTSNGPSVNLPAQANVGALRVGVSGTSLQEISRQEKVFQITIWADSPEDRRALATLIDVGLKTLSFVSLPDLTAGRIRYVSNRESDTAQKQRIYRRDLLFTVEYGTMLVEPAYEILTIVENVSVSVSNSATTQEIVTLYN